MKTRLHEIAAVGPLTLLAVLGAAALLALSLPASVAGVAIVLLALRMGVLVVGVEEPPRAPARRIATDAAEPRRLRAA